MPPQRSQVAKLYHMVYDEASQSRTYIEELADGDPYMVGDDVTLWEVYRPGSCRAC